MQALNRHSTEPNPAPRLLQPLFVRSAEPYGWLDRHTTFSLRWYRRAALRVALCAPCGVPDVVLHAPCVVPDAVLRGPRVVPDAVPYQTSASQWKAWRAWWAASGRQHLTPSELQARLQVQTQLRIQKEQERFDDRPASIPNVHPYQAPCLLPSCTSPKFQRVAIDLNQPGRWQQIHRARLSRR